MPPKPVGVLVMAYGTPENREDILRYYTDIRRGRPPSQEELAALVARYDAIGGASPLKDITFRQAKGLAAELTRRDLGRPFAAYVGMRHAPPFIAQAVAQMAEDRVEDAVALVLAPHYSAMSVGAYLERAEAARAQTLWPRRLLPIPSWHLEPSYIAFLAGQVRHAAATFPESASERVEYIFTAHSLPARLGAAGDPYPHALAETAEAVALALGLPHFRIAWQSAGRTSEPWLGPDILTVLADVRREGYEGALVCPCGFVSDHLEILYDLDIEARARAEELGLAFRRTAMGNDDPEFLRVLADVVERAWQRSGAA